jgi:hypothetical protein
MQEDPDRYPDGSYRSAVVEHEPLTRSRSDMRSDHGPIAERYNDPGHLAHTTADEFWAHTGHWRTTLAGRHTASVRPRHTGVR